MTIQTDAPEEVLTYSAAVGIEPPGFLLHNEMIRSIALHPMLRAGNIAGGRHHHRGRATRFFYVSEKRTIDEHMILFSLAFSDDEFYAVDAT